MDVGILTGGLSPNNHRSTAVASHGLIRLLLACFCSFAERSRFNRIDPKHYLPQAYCIIKNVVDRARLSGQVRLLHFEAFATTDNTAHLHRLCAKARCERVTGRTELAGPTLPKVIPSPNARQA